MVLVLHLCVLYVSENKLGILPNATLTDQFCTEVESVYCAVRTEPFLYNRHVSFRL
jgi:hypothetical protein